MKKTAFYSIVGLTLFACFCLSCSGKKNKSGRTDTYSSGVASFASDESFSPIIDEEVELFQFTYPQATLKPIYTNESDAITMLLQGKICLAVTARDYRDMERQSLRDKSFNPRAIPIAYDGLALIVNKANNDTCISVKDFAAIMSGKITQWKQLNPKSDKGEVLIVFDNKKSSTVHFVEDSILGGKPITNPNMAATNNTADVIKYVEENVNAIGIIGSNWLNDKRDTTNLTFKKNIRTMSVSRLDKATPANSWKPYQYYIYNGNYPLSRTIYALLNDPLRGLPWGFANFMHSPKGQLIIFKSGLLPVQGNITIRDVNITK